MFNSNNMALLLCLCIGVSIINVKLESQVERNNKMNEKIENKWLEHLKQTTKLSGQFEGKDKTGVSVVFDWARLNVQSPEFAETLKSIGDVTSKAYVPVESGFLRANPNLEFDDHYLKQFEAFFLNGHENVDWTAVGEKVQQVIKQFYSMDHSKFSADNMYFFVTVKDKKTKEMLGAIIFFVMPEYPYGDVKCTSFAVLPSAQGRGLGKFLMSSIFIIIPDLNRIFLCTRPTNANALNAYRAWGFVDDVNPIKEPYFKANTNQWASFEYKVNSSDILQRIAKTLTDIK
ncbi:GNAT family N-acetyltransferase [bacterium]|jgi:ribosomal protein S18 acetylase RimI-like enzyme|nr:GNAT family N-acetyltransferase [bacterium]